MYSIERRNYNETNKKYTYILENIDDQGQIIFECDKLYEVGKLVSIMNEELIQHDIETIKRKENLQKRVDRLFGK